MAAKTFALSKNYYLLLPDTNIVHKHASEEKFDLHKLSTKVSIYEDRVRTWFLDIAKRLERNNEAGFVILSIAVAYIEGNQQFREGKSSRNHSKKFFVRGVQRIFEKEDVPKDILEQYYYRIRCWLFHEGMTGKNVAISGEFDRPIAHAGGSDGRIEINPHLFLDRIISDFDEYVKQLKSDSKPLVESFEKKWKIDYE